MRINKPPPRLRDKLIGDAVQLKDDQLQREFIVYDIRDDGYYLLYHNGRLSVTASPCHEIEE